MLSALSPTRLCTALMIGALFVSSSLLAAVYPERGSTDVILLADPRVDFSVRFELIASAKSIDILTLSHTMDSEIGLPTALALRAAAARGVPIRYIFDGLASRMENNATTGIKDRGAFRKSIGDAANDFTYLIADSQLKRPADIYWLDADWKWRMGLASDDFFHEKIMIFNRGLPNEAVIVGSRNIGNSVLSGMDMALLLRPVHSPTAYAGTDVIQHFDAVWNLLGESGKKLVRVEPLPKVVAKLLETPSVNLLANRVDLTQEFAGIQNALAAPASETDPLLPNQFRPPASQVITNDLIAQVLKQNYNVDFLKRTKQVSDDIITAANRLAADARTISLSTYAVSFPDSLESTLQEAIKRNALVTIYTNGREAHWRNKDGGIGSTAMDMTLKNLQRLTPLLSEFNVRFYFLSYEKASTFIKRNATSVYPWLHRKWIAIDDWVAIGSHNLTQSASVKNSEIMVFFNDPRLRRYTESIFEKNRGQIFERAFPWEIKAEMENSSFVDRLRSKLLLDTVRELY